MTPEERVEFGFINAPDCVLARDGIIGASDIDEAKAHIAGMIRAAIAEEREACAKIAETTRLTVYGDEADQIAAAIRART